ncbi:hypothetical protein GNT69_11485 [Bacillus sp. B15-48]|nr:hypothetical protein [Bacillus sp. B15-48]
MSTNSKLYITNNSICNIKVYMNDIRFADIFTALYVRKVEFITELRG